MLALLAGPAFGRERRDRVRGFDVRPDAGLGLRTVFAKPFHAGPGGGAGAQNAILPSTGSVRLGSTFVTGALFATGQDLARALRGVAPPWRWAQHMLVWMSLLLGGLLGGLGYRVIGINILLVPGAVYLGFLIAFLRCAVRAVWCAEPRPETAGAPGRVFWVLRQKRKIGRARHGALPLHGAATEQATMKTASQNYQARMQRVLDHIDQHLDDDLDLEAVSRIAAFSKYHFHRQFMATFQLSLHRYVQLARLKRASHELASDAQSVTAIAMDAGYDAPDALARAFRQRFGQSPSSFRKSPEWGSWLMAFGPLDHARNKLMQINFDADDVTIGNGPLLHFRLQSQNSPNLNPDR